MLVSYRNTTRCQNPDLDLNLNIIFSHPSWGDFLTKIFKYFLSLPSEILRGCTQKFPDWVDNEMNNNNKHSLRSNTKGYGCKTHQTDSQNSDTAARSGRELYHLQFSLQAASPNIFGYTPTYLDYRTVIYFSILTILGGLIS
jgi:hypothetical protein